MKKLTGPIDLIGKSIEIFIKRDNFFYFFKVYSLLIPFALFTILENQYFKIDAANLDFSNPGALLATYGWWIGASVIVNLAFLVISFWISASGIKAVSEIVNDTRLSVAGVLKYSWKRLWGFAVLSFLLGLIEVFGGILLVIPAIIFAVWFSFAKYIFISEEKKVINSFGASRRLVAGRFWQVLGRLVVFGLFGGIIQLILTVIPLGIGEIFLPLTGALTLLPSFLLYNELRTRAASV